MGGRRLHCAHAAQHEDTFRGGRRGSALGIDAASWAAIVICIVLVLAAECLNTAVESVVDLVSPDYAELAKHAKDCAAGAVLVCALGAVAVAAAVFVPRLAALFV